MLPVIVMVVLVAGGSGTSGRHTVPLLVAQSSPPTYVADQHWGGLDAPSHTSISFTQIMWIQQTPTADTGTLVFELRHSDGTLLCSGSTTCDAAANTDVRSSCSATLGAGEHANLMIGVSSTCTVLAGGQIVLSGDFGG